MIPAIRVQAEQEQQADEQEFASKHVNHMRLNSVFTKLFIEMVTCVMLVHTHTRYLNTQLSTAAAHNRGVKHSFTNNTW